MLSVGILSTRYFINVTFVLLERGDYLRLAPMDLPHEGAGGHSTIATAVTGLFHHGRLSGCIDSHNGARGEAAVLVNKADLFDDPPSRWPRLDSRFDFVASYCSYFIL
jgi:hypothetical protein